MTRQLRIGDKIWRELGGKNRTRDSKKKFKREQVRIEANASGQREGKTAFCFRRLSRKALSTFPRDCNLPESKKEIWGIDYNFHG